MPEPKKCDQCGDMIIWHDVLRRFVNWNNTQNGKRGDPHTHLQRFIVCNRCSLKYDSSQYYQCYNCFQQVCQKCGKMYIWSSKQNTCDRCGFMCGKMITLTVLDKETKKYVKKDSTFINYEIMLIIEEYQNMKDAKVK